MIRPIRSTTQIWVMSVISMEFLRLFLRSDLAGKPLVASPNDDCFLKLGTLNSLQSIVYNNSYLVVYFTVRFSLRVSPHAIRESGFLNPANFCLWNPGSYTLQGGIQLKESGIALSIPIHNSGSTDKDWNLVAGLESKP